MHILEGNKCAHKYTSCICKCVTKGYFKDEFNLKCSLRIRRLDLQKLTNQDQELNNTHSETGGVHISYFTALLPAFEYGGALI